MNQLFRTAALWPIEFAANQIIKSDQYLLTALSQFDERVLEVNSTAPTTSICIQFYSDGIRLSALSSQDLAIQTDASVSASTSKLLDLLLANQGSSALSNPDIHISGDAQFIHEVFKTLKNLDLNWDDLLAPLLGGEPTHLLRNASDNAKRWSNNTQSSIKANVSEYLSEESRLLPRNTHLEEFSNRMDTLKLRIDRANARAELIHKQLDS